MCSPKTPRTAIKFIDSEANLHAIIQLCPLKYLPSYSRVTLSYSDSTHKTFDSLHMVPEWANLPMMPLSYRKLFASNVPPLMPSLYLASAINLFLCKYTSKIGFCLSSMGGSQCYSMDSVLLTSRTGFEEAKLVSFPKKQKKKEGSFRLFELGSRVITMLASPNIKRNCRHFCSFTTCWQKKKNINLGLARFVHEFSPWKIACFPFVRKKVKRGKH